VVVLGECIRGKGGQKTEDSNRTGKPQVSGGFLGVQRNALKGISFILSKFWDSFCFNSLQMALVNLQEKFGDDPISGRGLLEGNSPLWVATTRGLIDH